MITASDDRRKAQWKGLREEYEREGFTIARQVIDADLVREARAHVDWLMEKHPDVPPEMLKETLVSNDPFWVRLISDERLVDLAEEFIGPNIALFASSYFAKPPRKGRPVLWHQDGAYWPLEPMQVVSLWLAVTSSDPENGCLRVIPRTQHLDLADLIERGDVENVLGSGMDENLVEAESAVDILLQPGDVEIHHPNLIHGSNANQSDRWRIGLTIRYIPTHTRITREIGVPFLLRGEAVPGVNEYLPLPKFDPQIHKDFAGSDQWR